MSVNELIKDCKTEHVKCNCGCGKQYKKWLNKPSPCQYEVIDCTSISKKPLSIKRLSDNQVFRLGDTITRTSATGKKYRKISYK